jgi:spermidine/putrescine transport system substrate-binding protein
MGRHARNHSQSTDPKGGAVTATALNRSPGHGSILRPVGLLKENAMKRTVQRLGACLAAIVLAAACGPAATPAPTAVPTEVSPAERTGSLTVLDWAGYDAPDFWTDFKSTYPKVTVNFEIGASDADIFGKMKAGDAADIFHPYSGWLQLYVDEGLVQAIDTSKLKNWDVVPDNFKKLGQVNGKQYFLPWDYGFSSILYRTDKVPEGVNSWAALLDPKYKGHISMWDDGPSAVTTSSYIHGWDETKVTADQLATIKVEWTKQRALNLFYWAGEPELVDGMAKGDVWVAYAWQGAYATLLGKGVPVAYANPKEGRNSWLGFYGIRAGVKDYNLALKFLDAKLGEATGKNVVSEFYYGDSNQNVMKGITDPTLVQAFSINDPTILSKTNFTPNVTADQRDAWAKMWTEVKAAP